MILNSSNTNSDLKSMLEGKNNIQILISFGNGTWYGNYSKRFDPETLLSLYTLFNYTSHKKETLDDFIGQFPAKWTLDLSDVLQCIAFDFQERTKTSQPPVIYLGMDEINQVISKDKSNFDAMTKKISHILNQCDKRYFLIPIFAGTTEKSAKEIIRGSHNDPAHIPCPLLELEQTETIILKLDEKDDTHVRNKIIFFFFFCKQKKKGGWFKIIKIFWRSSFEFRQILIDVGGHPRVFESFIENVIQAMEQKEKNISKWISYDQNNQIDQLKIPFDFDWKNIYIKIEDYIKTKYGLIEVLPFRVIQNAFLGTKIMRQNEAVFFFFFFCSILKNLKFFFLVSISRKSNNRGERRNRRKNSNISRSL